MRVRIFLFEKMDHSIGLLSDAVVVKIPAAEMLDLMDLYPRIERAVMWATLVDESESFTMPLTQGEMADTTGITTVHVNRSLQRLGKEGLIETKDGRLTILDFAGLTKLSGFDPADLHTDGPPGEQTLWMRRYPM